MRHQPAHRVPAVAALQGPLRALDLLVQRIAFDVREHVPVHADLVQVARAVVEPLHVPATGHAAVGAVAQRIVGMAPGVASERGFPTRRQVLLHLFGEARERVVGEVHAGIGIAGVQHAAQQVVGEGGEAAAGALFHAVRPQVRLGDEAPHGIAAKHGAFGQGCRGIGIVGGVQRLAGIALLQFGQLARGVVAVALDPAVEADFFDEVVRRVVGEASGGSLRINA